MEENAASVDECVSWLQHQVLDLLSLRGVVTKLATNWEQLKLSLEEKGLLRGTAEQSVDDRQGPPPPTVPAESTEAVPTIAASIGPVQPTDTRGHDEPAQSIELSTETFIGPVTPTDAMKSTAEDIEQISKEPGASTAVFIGPVIPGDAARLTSEHGEITPSVEIQSQTAVQDERTEMLVEKNGNGNMETSETATVQSSGLQMN